MAFTTHSRTENMGDVLRRANLHCSALAKAVRAALRPTHHAKKHALALQLSVSTQAAAKLDQRQISVLPLPILDLAPSPLPAFTSHPTEASSDTIRIFAPTPIYLSEIQVNELNQEICRPARPSLRCVIPSPKQASLPISLEIVHSPALECLSCDFGDNMKSRWSASTVGETGNSSAFVENDAAEGGMSAFEEHQDGNPPCSSPSFIEREEDEAIASLRPRVAVSGFARSRISIPAHLTQPRHSVGLVITQQKLSNSPPRLDVPVDLSRMSWGSDLFLGPHSGSSRSSSCGPVTPRTPDHAHQSTAPSSSKRKANPFESADDDSVATALIFEKRPRFERKPWVMTTTHRREHTRGTSISSRRRF
ncbi:hypothetical protein CPB83DRAFT_857780 [Crepidotus variabilis]|uniref:Uncharacterized protein n=1 Tax=Crepidotus variabilis TaxID=179855 RepID=A0A9P6ECE7_9AGAR|nr:hypothetical protein CPB83DRAFT_857780 [Crepidotus variabilis]